MKCDLTTYWILPSEPVPSPTIPYHIMGLKQFSPLTKNNFVVLRPRGSARGGSWRAKSIDIVIGNRVRKGNPIGSNLALCVQCPASD